MQAQARALALALTLALTFLFLSCGGYRLPEDNSASMPDHVWVCIDNQTQHEADVRLRQLGIAITQRFDAPSFALSCYKEQSAKLTQGTLTAEVHALGYNQTFYPHVLARMFVPDGSQLLLIVLGPRGNQMFSHSAWETW